MQYNSLSNLHISQVVDALSTYLASTTLPKEDCIRTTFAIEEALLLYQEKLGEQTLFSFTCGKKWGKAQFALTICGGAINPFESTDDAQDSLSVMQTLLGRMGLFPNWKYTAGRNVIAMVLPKVPRSPLKKWGLPLLRPL